MGWVALQTPHLSLKLLFASGKASENRKIQLNATIPSNCFPHMHFVFFNNSNLSTSIDVVYGKGRTATEGHGTLCSSICFCFFSAPLSCQISAESVVEVQNET